MSEVLTVRLRVAAQRRVSIDASFEVSSGVTVLFGPSGVGKSTLLLAIAGLFRPDAGRIALGQRVLFDAEARVSLRPEERRTALVFQSLALFPHMSVLDNVSYGLKRGLSRKARVERAEAWLLRMRVAHLAARKPGTLSGGEGQRVALARALASEPDLLLLDEPFSAMDEVLRMQLGQELRDVLAEASIPALLVTHDRRDAARLADRILVMSQGKVDCAEAVACAQNPKSDQPGDAANAAWIKPTWE